MATVKTVLPVNLQSSICTDTPTGADLWQFGDEAATHIVNTGIERNGGIAPIYEQETTFPTAGQATMIAKDGTVVQVDASNNVRLNDQVIGNVGPLAIAQRGKLSGYLDAAWTADGTLIAITRVGTSMFVYEIDPATGSILHSRSNVFAGMPSKIVNICLVKYVDMHYADNQEFIVQTALANFLAYVLRESGTSTTVLTGIASSIASIFFCWRFAAAKYIYGNSVNSAGSLWYTGDLTAATTQLTPLGIVGVPVFITIDRFPGTAFSRAILTFGVFKNAANLLTGIGEVGYTSAGVYSGTATFYGIALAAITATVSNPITGPGYSECTFTRSDTGANIYYYYASPFAHNVAAYFLSAQNNTATPINGYGKLSDIFNTTTGANVVNLVSWRIVFINGQQSFISAAPIGTTWDCIGVPITNVGEMDDSFLPIVNDDGAATSNILYRYQGNLYYVKITSTATHTLQKVSDDIYMVNSLSALNAISVMNKRLVTGTTDYNGRLIYQTVAAAAGTFQNDSLIQGRYSNSVDPGVKISTQQITFFNMGIRLFCPGIDAPSFWDRFNDYAINYYEEDTSVGTFPYIGSFIAYAIPVFLSDFVGLTYVPDTRLPFGMGYPFQERTMQTEVETIFTGVGVVGSADINFNYLGYELGNDSPAIYLSFVLFGQTFLFDGNNIWFASFTGSLFSGRGSSPVCPATGMVLIATSPTEVFFLSSFDDSLYSFDGGRALRKVKRMNDLRNSSGAVEAVINGVFSVRDNSLLLQTASTFVWIRDSIVTQNNKKANQTTIALYDTVNGATIANNTLKWIYSFLSLSASTVVPLTWQSPYLGVTTNRLGVITAFFVTLFSLVKAGITVNIIVDGFDQESAWHEDHPFTIQPGDYDSLGFWRSARVVPDHTLTLGVSVGTKITGYATINRVEVELTPDMTATPSAARSG
jgi:hypothetical protein